MFAKRKAGRQGDDDGPLPTKLDERRRGPESVRDAPFRRERRPAPPTEDENLDLVAFACGQVIRAGSYADSSHESRENNHVGRRKTPKEAGLDSSFP
jgi:hypothetical protein